MVRVFYTLTIKIYFLPFKPQSYNIKEVSNMNLFKKKVIKNNAANLKVLENQGMYQKYGFYESIDYTPGRLEKNKKYEPVKTYMAHHQGLILI